MKPKIIDQKTQENLLDRIESLAKSYAPDWRPNFDQPDFASALSLIFRDMYLEQIERLNRLPQKQRRDIVNLLDPSLIRPRASRGYISFLLNESATQGHFIDSGFQLLAEGPDEREVYFETTKPLYISDARIAKCFVYTHENGWLSAHTPESGGVDFPLFEIDPALNINEAGMTLDDPNWLNLRPDMRLYIAFETTHEMDTRRLLEGLINTSKARFTANSGEDAFPLNAQLHENMICLEVPKGHHVSGQVHCQFLDLTYFRDITLSGLQFHIQTENMSPQGLLYNDIPLEVSKKHRAILPFGDAFNVFDVFMIGEDELFTKPGAQVTLDFKVKTFLKTIEQVGEAPLVKWRNIMHESELREPEEKRIRIENITWEYWNGTGWTPLQMNPEAYTIPEEGLWQVHFICPKDIQKAIFGPMECAYIRARITKVENAFAPLGETAVPMFSKVHAHIDTIVQSAPCIARPQALIRQSNLETKRFEHKELAHAEVELVPPPDTGLFKAIYIALTKPLSKGPIRFEISPVFTDKSEEKALFKMQYYGQKSGRRGWYDMRHEDETDGFTMNGLISIMAPEAMLKAQRFNTHNYWLRIIPIGTENGMHLPQNYGRNISLRMNGMEITQQETLDAEYFSTAAIQPSITLHLSRAPILKAQVWVNELGSISEAQAETYKKTHPGAIRIEKDKSGEHTGIWVQWQQVRSFFDDHPSKRIFTLDAAKGIITFGDGKHGKIPHSDLPEFIEVNYALGGGTNGNVESMQINKAISGIPFLEGVYNGSPTWGGLDGEWTQTAENRISQYIRHRNIALSASDIKAIITAGIRDVNDVCVTAHQGDLAISILPDTYPYQTSHFFEIKNRVQEVLETALSHTVYAQKRYKVTPPVHIAYSITMDVNVTSAGDYIKALSAWHDKLDAYFHPLRGGILEKGWSIGNLPDHTKVMTDLGHMMEGSERIENIMIQRHILWGQKKLPLTHKQNLDQIDLKHAIPVSGDHDIRIRISGT